MLLPPPNVTGSLHMGHAFNHTLMDILARWHRMRGHDVLWQPGLDHAGIATQMVVERELAKHGGNAGRREMGREAFVAKVWEWKEQSGGTILEQSRRLGDSFDLSPQPLHHGRGLPRRGFAASSSSSTTSGLIFRGKRLVNWDPHFETAISDLEVEQVETEGQPLAPALSAGERRDLPASDRLGRGRQANRLRDRATTSSSPPPGPRPCSATPASPSTPTTRATRHLVGKTVRLPLVGRSIPIVADAYADPAKGTGAVKITPAHDFNDWEVGQRCGLAAINVMDTPRPDRR